MKLCGMTLIETVISLAILAIIALGTSTAFSTAGNIFRRTEDIKETADNCTLKMAELYENTDISSDNPCSLKINDSITISGKLLQTTTENNTETEFSGYYSVKPIPDTVSSEVNNEIQTE